MRTYENVTVYILGPMRGIPKFNFPAFDAMAEKLRSFGFCFENPAHLDRQAGFNPHALPRSYDWSKLPKSMKLGEIIDRDVSALRRCTAYVALPGWEKSTGARAEKALLDWQGAQRLDPAKCFLPWSEPETPSAPELSHKEVASGLCAPTTLQDCVLHPEKNSQLQAMGCGEVRITDPKTGGQKGQKLARFDLIPGEPLFELAEVYGRGSVKYSDDNWRKGYSWKLSFGALNRHLWSWWGGETRDPETGNHHLACVAWHAFTLMWYQLKGRGTDDRPRYELTPAPVLQ